MAKTKQRQLSAEEEARLMMQWSLPKLPETIKKQMLADHSVLAILDLPIGPLFRLWGQPFGKADLFSCLRDAVEGRSANLTSVDGTLAVEETRVEADGAVVLRVGDESLRFPRAQMLSQKCEDRQRGLTGAMADGVMSPEREAIWRAAIAQGPLDDALFFALETELSANPESVFEEMAREISIGDATFNDLVPLDENHYAGLLNLYPPPATSEGFSFEWLKRASQLEGVRLTRLLKLSGPLSVLSGGLVARASDALSVPDRAKVIHFLGSRPDPFSVLAAFEISCRHHADPGVQSNGGTLLERLLNRADALIELAAPALAACVDITTALTARIRTFAAWPLYAKRLARLSHANHLLRVFREANVDPSLFSSEVSRTLEPQARLADLCDSNDDPVYQWRYFMAPTIHALLVTRALEAISEISEAERPSDWIEAAQKASQDDAESGWGSFLFAPQPLNSPDENRARLVPLGDAEVAELQSAFKPENDPARRIEELFKLAVQVDVLDRHRDEVGRGLIACIEQLEGTDFLVGAELTLQLAARWRNTNLSDRMINVVISRADKGDFADAGVAPRLIMLASASVEDRTLWFERTGAIASGFAFAQRSGFPSVNFMRALDLLRDFEPELGPHIAQAKAIATLTFTGSPRPANSQPPGEAVEEEGTTS